MKYPDVIKYKGQEIKIVQIIKCLGVNLTRDMKWREHIRLIDQKIDKFIKIFNLMKYMNNKELDLDEKKIIYNQVCIPIISYG